MPKTLTPARRDHAVAYLTTHARPLERALYAWHFANGSPDAVLTELAKFQNPDGGFGHSLEPDIRLADSSVIATTIAFQLFRDLGTPAGHPMIERACAYLRATYDAEHKVWFIIPPNVSDAPHALWWEFRPNPAQHLINPRAEIAAYLHDYAKHFPAALRNTVTAAVVDHLLALNEIEMHDLLCYLRFAAAPTLPDAVRAAIQPKLTALVQHTVASDPAQWSGYGMQPLDVAPTPDSPYRALFANLIDANLDLRIDQQSEDGSWQPPWSWGDLHPNTWPQARQDWAGVLTLKNLLLLRAYARLP